MSNKVDYSKLDFSKSKYSYAELIDDVTDHLREANFERNHNMHIFNKELNRLHKQKERTINSDHYIMSEILDLELKISNYNERVSENIRELVLYRDELRRRKEKEIKSRGVTR